MSSNELEGQLVRTHDDTRRFKILRISTAERTNGFPYDFTVNLGNDQRLDAAIELHLLTCSIPNIANNISAAIGNNFFHINFAIAGPFTFIIPDGFYNVSEITNYITTFLNPFIAPTVLSITQDPITGRLTFNSSGPDTFQFIFGSPDTLAATLGSVSSSGAGMLTWTLENLPSLYGATYFFIHSQELGPELTYLQTDGSDPNSVNGMFSIPVNVDYGSLQTYQAIEQDRVVFGRVGRSARNFKITLRTNGGRLYTELTDNQEVIIVMRMLWSTSRD